MKKKLSIGIAVVVIIVVGFIGFCMWFLSGTGSTYYYSQIDNSKIEQTESKGGVINFSGSMDYSYTLFSDNENAWRKRPVKSRVCGLKDSMVRQEYDKINSLNGLK